MRSLLRGADDAVAVIDGDTGEQWSYARVREDVAALARRLPQRAGPGLVLVYSDVSVAAVAALLAAWEAGHAALLADAATPEDVRKSLEAAYKPDAVIETAGEGAPRVVSGSHSGVPAVADGLRLVLLTSGSTGSPKGVRLSHDAVVANATAIAQALQIDQSQRAVLSLPLHYTYGLSVLLSHLVAGASVVTTQRSIIQREFRDVLAEHEVTSMAGVPYTYRLIERTRLLDALPDSMRRLTQAGGRLDTAAIVRVHEALASRGRTLWVMYGQTEACARMSVLPPAELPARAGAVGWPVPGGSFVIENPAGDDGHGEVVYRGPNVMWGYAGGRDDLTRGDELHGVLHTGDIGRLDADGCLWLLGRASRFAKVAGIRVSLDDVEGMLEGHGELAAVSDGEGIRIYCDFGDDAEYRRLARELAARLRLHHSAFAFERVGGVPRTPQGKTDYAALQR